MQRHGRANVCRGMLALAAGLLCLSPPAQAVPDLKLFRAASCEALASEYRFTLDVNKSALKEMRRSEVASSESAVGGVATIGAGAFNWNEGSDPEAVLAELADYQTALVTVAKEKKCALPASGAGPGSRPN